MTRTTRQWIAAGACALVAALCVFAYTASVRAEAMSARESAIAKYGGETAEVLVVTDDVGAGEELDAGNAAVETWPVDLLPDADVATSLDEVAGEVALTDLVCGEVVLASRLDVSSSRINVPSGLTAVTVSSDDVLAVGGAIQAGSLVDVYVEDSSSAVALLGEQILVLETSTSGDDGDEVAWVTLAVTSKSVADLMGASTQGTIHFALPASSADDSADDGDSDADGTSADGEVK